VLGRAAAPADASGDSDDDTEIDALVDRRLDAKAKKNFGEADRIRDELTARGVVLEDTPRGTAWRRG
jgi:cysteinyl-tRNA synthetase